MLCRNPCGLYIHLAFSYFVGPSSVVWGESGPVPPFPPMRVLEVKWSQALSLGLDVALDLQNVMIFLRPICSRVESLSWKWELYGISDLKHNGPNGRLKKLNLNPGSCIEGKLLHDTHIGLLWWTKLMNSPKTIPKHVFYSTF